MPRKKILRKQKGGIIGDVISGVVNAIPVLSDILAKSILKSPDEVMYGNKSSEGWTNFNGQQLVGREFGGKRKCRKKK